MTGQEFTKWHGTGNDFILVDDRAGTFPSTDARAIQRMCDRHFGVGSDGLILIQAPRSAGSSFHMEFFNPDASRSFCGNGSRCAFAFWRTLQGEPWHMASGDHVRASFTAIDGLHLGMVRTPGEVAITLNPSVVVERIDGHVDLMDTGSPHLLVWVEDPETVDILPAAHAYRYNDRFRAAGVNVNFVRWNAAAGRVEMRTYERGVEAETLSCGTGVTAAALDARHRGLALDKLVQVVTRGGRLQVDTTGKADGRVELIGPVEEVFRGTLTGLITG